MTLPDSGKSTVLAIRQNILASSLILPLLSEINMDGEFVYQPINTVQHTVANIAKLTATIASLMLRKKVVPLYGKLTDETEEDLTPSASLALNACIQNQLKIFSELNIAQDLMNSCLAANMPAISISIPNVLDLVNSLEDQVRSSKGNIILLMSFSSYLTLISLMNKGLKEILERRNIIPVYAPGVTDHEMAVIHSGGAAFGLEIKSIDRVRAINGTILEGSYNYAAAVISGYGYKVALV